MDTYKLKLRRFFRSEYFTDGLRNTLLIVAPVLIFFQLGNEQAALGVGSGALLISLTDLPGNRLQKYRTAFLSILLFFIVALVFTNVFFSPVLTAIAFLIVTFLLSMLSAFSVRAGLTGTMAIILSTFLLGLLPPEPLRFSLCILAGGCWFYLFTLLQISFRPFRSLHNALEDYTRAIAEVLRVKGKCYDERESLDSVYQLSIGLHIALIQKQDQLRSLLLADPRALHASAEGKLMLARVIKLIELYEQVSAIHYDYMQIRSKLAPSGLLPQIVRMIDLLAADLEDLAGSFIQNAKVSATRSGNAQFEMLHAELTSKSHFAAQPHDVLRKILKNLNDINSYIQQLNSAAHTYDDSIHAVDEKLYQDFLPEKRLKLQEFLRLFSFNSPVFRFSVRLAVSFLLAYAITVILGQQKYSYWMLLTIVIVARPRFGITWKRNIERLTGTFGGVLVGLALLFLIHSPTILILLSITFLLGFFVFNRLNYRVSVACITPAIILCLSLYHGHTSYIASERILYTIVGCLISFAGVYLFPVWERSQLPLHIRSAVASNSQYLSVVLNFRNGKESAAQVKLVRKNAHNALAVLSESLKFMLLEPGRSKIDLKSVYLVQTLIFNINSVITSILLATRDEDVSDQVNFLQVLSVELDSHLGSIDARSISRFP